MSKERGFGGIIVGGGRGTTSLSPLISKQSPAPRQNPITCTEKGIITRVQRDESSDAHAIDAHENDDDDEAKESAEEEPPCMPSSYKQCRSRYDKYMPYAPYLLAFAVTFIMVIILGPMIDRWCIRYDPSKVDMFGTSENKYDPTVDIYNDYTKQAPYSDMYPFENIVEPYRVTYFKVINPVRGMKYSWYIDGWHKEDGQEVPITFTEVTGKVQTVMVNTRRESGEIVGTRTIEVMCKYVRREIRSLLDQVCKSLCECIFAYIYIYIYKYIYMYIYKNVCMYLYIPFICHV
jgi:hypothetical protein